MAQVRLLGYYTLLQPGSFKDQAQPAQLAEIKTRVIAFADTLLRNANNNAYQTVMTNSAKNFGWGSTPTRLIRAQCL